MLFCVLAFGLPGVGGGGIDVKWHKTHLVINQNIFRISILTKNFSGMILRSSHAE